jgi:hypothetical protein
MMLKRYKIVGEERDRREGRVELMSYHQHSSPSKVNTIIQVPPNPVPRATSFSRECPLALVHARTSSDSENRRTHRITGQ